MTKTAAPAPLTVKAVVRHAATLRDRADRLQRQDPYPRKLCYPTTAAAYKLFETMLTGALLDFGSSDRKDPELVAEAARRAIMRLDQRVAREQIEHREGEEHARRAALRHRRRSTDARRDRDARRSGRDVAARIGDALAELSVIGSVQASTVDTDVITDSKASSREPRFCADPAGEAKYVAVQAARRIEGLLEEARRRCVENQLSIA